MLHSSWVSRSISHILLSSLSDTTTYFGLIISAEIFQKYLLFISFLNRAFPRLSVWRRNTRRYLMYWMSYTAVYWCRWGLWMHIEYLCTPLRSWREVLPSKHRIQSINIYDWFTYITTQFIPPINTNHISAHTSFIRTRSDSSYLFLRWNSGKCLNLKYTNAFGYANNRSDTYLTDYQ